MAKRSRRERKQRKTKSTQPPVAAQVEPTPVAEKPQPVETEQSALQSTSSKFVNFAEDYFYVYTELRNVLIVAVFMFVIMFGLAYFV